MKINIYSLKHLLEDVLIQKGIAKKDAVFIANDYWIAEISGKKTHGIIKFYKELAYYNDKKGSPQIIIDKGPIALVDANREIGQLSAKFCIDLLKKRTKRYGVAIVGMKNSQRYGVLSTWVKILAESSLIGIAINSSEPATAVYGGISPVLGTNPIAIAIPMHNKKPILIDMATSKSPMGSLLYSSIYNRPLSSKTFIDKKGQYTTKPNEVHAVENFGGYKGYALSLALEVLSGSLLSAKMGSEIKSHYDVGY
ncbi:MAG: Ldh family oxidoreductase, partial [Candidatus Levybacteria bacterium]|nr:Ldh family oxidoreductase [Candidatus Levybacteria bacterium]